MSEFYKSAFCAVRLLDDEPSYKYTCEGRLIQWIYPHSAACKLNSFLSVVSVLVLSARSVATVSIEEEIVVTLILKYRT
jgi:hypothetical protein